MKRTCISWFIAKTINECIVMYSCSIQCCWKLQSAEQVCWHWPAFIILSTQLLIRRDYPQKNCKALPTPLCQVTISGTTIQANTHKEQYALWLNLSSVSWPQYRNTEVSVFIEKGLLEDLTHWWMKCTHSPILHNPFLIECAICLLHFQHIIQERGYFTSHACPSEE